METIGTFVMFFGLIVSVIAGIWFLIAAFSENILWGLGCMFVPFVSLFFLILHWNKAGKPFLVNLVGLALLFGGAFMSGPNATHRLAPEAEYQYKLRP
jgi:hypothetical protein